MNQADAARRIAELRAKIRHRDCFDHGEARPEISDAERAGAGGRPAVAGRRSTVGAGGQSHAG